MAASGQAVLFADCTYESNSMVTVPDARASAKACGSGLPKADRLRARRQFLAAQRQGARVHTPHFVVLLLPSDRQRFGVTVTRRVAGAVGRNRIKRVAREVFRQNRGLFPASCDIVLVARRGADALDYALLQAELSKVAPAMVRACKAKQSASDSSATRRSSKAAKDPT